MNIGTLANLGLQSLVPTTSIPITTLPAAVSPTTSFGGLQCFTGRVNLLVFIQASDIVAQLTTTTGQTILLATNSPVIRAQLSAVDNRFATVCGTFVIRNNRLVLEVQVVIPQQITPPINLQQLLLLLLLLFLSRGQLPIATPFSTTTGLGAVINQFGGISALQQALAQMGGATGVTNLVNQLGGEAAITSQLQAAGIAI